jgi:transcriptional regulator GlxA family with amidase domain
VFFVPLVPPRGVRWDGEAMTADTLIIGGPNSQNVVFAPRGSEFAVVSMRRDAAPEVIAAARAALDPSAAGGAIQAAPAAARALVQELLHVRAIVEMRAPDLTIDLMHDADATIRRRLCACLSTAVTARRGDGARSSIVRRAERLVREHVGEAISISQLSLIAGVSERSLRNAFYCVCTTGPKRYLRMLRLHQVRRSLRAAAAGTATVTYVATQHGFYELGRFAGEYRALFGETPSETLQRARLGSPIVSRPAARPA